VTFWLDAQLPPSLAAWLSSTFHVEAHSLRALGLRDADGSRDLPRGKRPGRGGHERWSSSLKTATSWTSFYAAVRRCRYSGSPAATSPIDAYGRCSASFSQRRGSFSMLERLSLRSVTGRNETRREATNAPLPLPYARRVSCRRRRTRNNLTVTPVASLSFVPQPKLRGIRTQSRG